MAHFSKIDENNVVQQVIVVNNDVFTTEKEAQDFIASIGLTGRWVQTSYNTEKGVHKSGGTPFRGNYGVAGFIYDEKNDIFVLPKPEDTNTITWKLDIETASWISVAKQ
jgi:hypothetical protein